MPYLVWVCNDCDMMVHDLQPHGPEDEYCEGESGFERIEVFTAFEIRRKINEALDRWIGDDWP